MDPLAMPLDALVSASRKAFKKKKEKSQKKKVGGKMNRERKTKQKEPYNKTNRNNNKNDSGNNFRWKKGRFKGNNGLSDSRGSKKNGKQSYGFSNNNSSVKFRVTLDGSGDIGKAKKGGEGRRRNNKNQNRKRPEKNQGRRGRSPPVMTPQPQSAADLDADLESYQQKAPKKPVTVDDLDAEMDAYNSKRKQPKDDAAAPVSE